MLLLLGRRLGVLPDSDTYVRLLDGEPGRRPLASLLEADALARTGRAAEAIRMTDSPTPVQADSLGDPEVADPFLRTVLHLLRAAWYQGGHDADRVQRGL